MAFGEVQIRMNRLPVIAGGIRNNVARTVKQYALQCEAIAKKHAPVDTGALRNGIQAQEVTDLEWEVGPTVDYAIYQEYGTVFMPAQPFMQPAADAVRGPFLNAMRKAVQA